MSLRWAHIPFCWFCHEAAPIYMARLGFELVTPHLDLTFLMTKRTYFSGVEALNAAIMG